MELKGSYGEFMFVAKYIHNIRKDKEVNRIECWKVD